MKAPVTGEQGRDIFILVVADAAVSISTNDASFNARSLLVLLFSFQR